jgi:hypothetical protein
MPVSVLARAMKSSLVGSRISSLKSKLLECSMGSVGFFWLETKKKAPGTFLV